MTVESMPAPRRLIGLGLALAALVVALDQAVKYWILTEVMVPPRVIPVTEFFNLVLTWNRGVSFGLLSDGADFVPLLLMGLAAVIGMLLIGWLWRTDRLLIGVCLGIVLGGAMGNLVDRLVYGAVVDFLDFHVAGWHWPAFNVADSAISVGVSIIVLDSVFGGAPRTRAADESSED